MQKQNTCDKKKLPGFLLCLQMWEEVLGLQVSQQELDREGRTVREMKT